MCVFVLTEQAFNDGKPVSIYLSIRSYCWVTIFFCFLFLSRYINPASYQANNSGQVTQEQQQNYNYYYQQEKNYYYSPQPPKQSPTSGQPPGIPISEATDEPSGNNTQSNTSEQNSKEYLQQADNSVSASNDPDSIQVVPKGNSLPPESASVAAEHEHGQAVAPQGHNYDDHSQQSTGNGEGHQSYNPTAPSGEHSNWNQQQQQPPQHNSQQQEQQQQQQWGWVWNEHQGIWQPSWTQQQAQQQATGADPQQAVGSDQQQQWSGWGQWVSHGGGQWGMQPQQPGAEGWVGQHYQATPGYQQQGYNYQGELILYHSVLNY